MEMNDASDLGDAAREQRLALFRACADATDQELEIALAAFSPEPVVEDIRAPESGLVMVRGRLGGTGNAFNIGEAAVTRAVVKVAGGALGHACLLGRSHRRARMAATIDALGQNDVARRLLDRVLVQPVAQRRAAARQTTVEETAATRVDFFTLVRGEDA